MSLNSIDPIENNQKNIFFVKNLCLKNGKSISKADMQKISDISADVASIMWD